MKKYVISLLFTVVFIFSMIGGQAIKASNTYQVKTGDTLWEIALENNVTIDELMTWNELNSSLILPGQEIKVSSKGKAYVVKKGDTLSQIAETHDIMLTDLKRWNNIANHLIFPGEELTINGEKKVTVASASVNHSPKSTAPSSTPEKKVQNEQTNTKPTQNEQIPTAASGKEMTVTATAYTAYCEGCSGTTYTGIDLRANPNQKVIAVDPSIIPLGSRVWVEGYGEAIAGDIGGAIKGNIIDVFLEQQQEALNWGRRSVKIKVLD